MPGLDNLLGVWETKAAKGRPRESEAAELLKKIANQVKPICAAHRWKVQMLEEFNPPNPGLLGMNVGRQKIFIRLRPAGALDSFYPYEALLHTMLHELVHMEIGPHNAKFYKMLDELRDECEKLIREGITDSNMPFAGDGRSLGGGRAPIDVRAAALKAAERRQRQQSVMGGGQRLGGLATAAGSPAERAAAAAEWRQAVSRGCATTGAGGCHGGDIDGSCGSASSGSAQGGTSDNGWNCDFCSLRNRHSSTACDACGTPRPSGATVAGVDIESNGGEATSTRRPAAGRSNRSSRGEATLNDREERSRKAASVAAMVAMATVGGSASTVEGPGSSAAAAGAAAAAAAAAARKSSQNGSSTQRTQQHGRLRPISGGGGGGGGGGSILLAAGPPSGFGLPSTGDRMLGTWTCRKCPFLFPNTAERATCESCGARRGDQDGRYPDDRRESANEVWACSACTVLNPATFLVCGTCATPRLLLQQQVPQVLDAVASSTPSVLADGNSANDGSTQSLRSSSVARQTCPVCTLRNNVQAVVCAACGIPLAESEAAAVAVGRSDREDVAGRGLVAGAPEAAEVIDLS